MVGRNLHKNFPALVHPDHRLTQYFNKLISAISSSLPIPAYGQIFTDTPQLIGPLSGTNLQFNPFTDKDSVTQKNTDLYTVPVDPNSSIQSTVLGGTFLVGFSLSLSASELIGGNYADFGISFNTTPISIAKCRISTTTTPIVQQVSASAIFKLTQNINVSMYTDLPVLTTLNILYGNLFISRLGD